MLKYAIKLFHLPNRLYRSGMTPLNPQRHEVFGSLARTEKAEYALAVTMA
jgi:hypothetical protein